MISAVLSSDYCVADSSRNPRRTSVRLWCTAKSAPCTGPTIRAERERKGALYLNNILRQNRSHRFKEMVETKFLAEMEKGQNILRQNGIGMYDLYGFVQGDDFMSGWFNSPCWIWFLMVLLLYGCHIVNFLQNMFFRVYLLTPNISGHGRQLQLLLNSLHCHSKFSIFQMKRQNLLCSFPYANRPVV